MSRFRHTSFKEILPRRYAKAVSTASRIDLCLDEIDDIYRAVRSIQKAATPGVALTPELEAYRVRYLALKVELEELRNTNAF